MCQMILGDVIHRRILQHIPTRLFCAVFSIVLCLGGRFSTFPAERLKSPCMAAEALIAKAMRTAATFLMYSGIVPPPTTDSTDSSGRYPSPTDPFRCSRPHRTPSDTGSSRCRSRFSLPPKSYSLSLPCFCLFHSFLHDCFYHFIALLNSCLCSLSDRLV